MCNVNNVFFCLFYLQVEPVSICVSSIKLSITHPCHSFSATPSNTHNVIIKNLTYNIDDQLDARMAKFIHMCLNHDNEVCRSISLSKLLCKNSTFASNYSYLSCKYNLSHNDWHLDTSHLIGKVRLKNKQKSCHIGSCQDIIELCDIRDGLALCDTLSNDDVCKLIDIICLE